MRYEISVPAQLKITANQRWHWAKVRQYTNGLREIAALGCKVQGIGYQQERIDAGLTWFVADKRRRDPDNLVVPMFKALVDGVVDAGVIPDDTSLFVKRHMPEITYRPGERESFTFWIVTFDQYGEDL